MRRRAVVTGIVAVPLAGCTDADDVPENDPSAQASPSPSVTPSTTRPSEQTTSAAPTPRVSADDARIGIALETVDHLGGRIGTRPGTSPAYFRAADWVERRLVGYGWDVRRQSFHAPAGYSWNAPVAAGPSVNLIATRGEVRPDEPWLLVGAHLDTVAVAPGAEDNASGIGVLLVLADALADRRARLPVVLLAFGCEEPRGETDDDHHYGSRAFVAGLTPDQRRSLRGMVSMDRVGVGTEIPIGSVTEPSPLRAELVAAAESAGAAYLTETGQRSSDHWSFERDGLSGVRLGGTPYAGYHNSGDVPSVVHRDQLERTARTMLAWLR